MDATTTHRSSWFKRIWFGPEGLRAGWAWLLFLIILAVTIGILGGIAHVLHFSLNGHGHIGPLHTIVSEGIFCCAVLFATWASSRIDKRPWLSYALKARHGFSHFWQGAFWGVLMLSAIMAVLWLSGAASIRFSGADALALIKSGLLWAVAFFLVGAFEESAFRGFAFFRLTRGCKSPVFAAILTSLLFAGAHAGNHDEGFIGIIMVFAFGLVACIAIWRTGSLWWALGLHAACDWSESFLYGTSDSGLVSSGHLLTSHAMGPAWLSGGSVGPEGSVIVFPALALLALAAVYTLPKVRVERDVASNAHPVPAEQRA